MLRALVDVRAPLDLLGMTSDFLADECSHVEIASRLAMELGGAAPRMVDFDRFTTNGLGNGIRHHKACGSKAERTRRSWNALWPPLKTY